MMASGLALFRSAATRNFLAYVTRVFLADVVRNRGFRPPFIMMVGVLGHRWNGEKRNRNSGSEEGLGEHVCSPVEIGQIDQDPKSLSLIEIKKRPPDRSTGCTKCNQGIATALRLQGEPAVVAEWVVAAMTAVGGITLDRGFPFGRGGSASYGSRLPHDKQAAALEAWKGRTYYFCFKSCREKFRDSPGRYAPEGNDRGGALNTGEMCLPPSGEVIGKTHVDRPDAAARWYLMLD
jgi:YHS domain-containing protein